MADSQTTDTFSAQQGDKERLEETAAVAAYRRLRSTRKVSKELGIHRTRLRAILVKHGLLKEIDRKAWTHRKERQQQLQAERKAKGLCRYCDEPAEAGGFRCAAHLEEYRRKKVSNRGKGICVVCGKASEPGLSRCRDCLHRQRKGANRLYRDRLAAGLCRICGKSPFLEGFQTCETCKKAGRERLAFVRQQRKDAGLCDRCGKLPRTVKDKYCQDCYLAIVAQAHLGTVLDGPAIKRLWEESGGICAYSGRKLTLGVDAAVDHRVAITKGGSSSIDNLQWVHEMVNQMKRNYAEEEFLAMVSDIHQHRCSGG